VATPISREVGVVRVQLQSESSQRLAAERGQMYQVVIGNRLDRLTGFAPSREAADDHERVETLKPSSIPTPAGVG
jgi:hypothetical protein